MQEGQMNINIKEVCGSRICGGVEYMEVEYVEVWNVSRVTSPKFDGKFALHECHACDVVHLGLRRCIMRC